MSVQMVSPSPHNPIPTDLPVGKLYFDIICKIIFKLDMLDLVVAFHCLVSTKMSGKKISKNTLNTIAFIIYEKKKHLLAQNPHDGTNSCSIPLFLQL